VLATAARVRAYALGAATDSAASPSGGGTSNEEIGDASSSGLTWKATPRQGAQLWLVAVEK